MKIKKPEIQEFDNIKEIIYNSKEEYKNSIAFVVKNKKDGKINYENITYERLLEDINKLGTALYQMGFKGKRVAIIGKNRDRKSTRLNSSHS